MKAKLRIQFMIIVDQSHNYTYQNLSDILRPKIKGSFVTWVHIIDSFLGDFGIFERKYDKKFLPSFHISKNRYIYD